MFIYSQAPVKQASQAPAVANKGRKTWGTATESWDDWDEFGLEDVGKATQHQANHSKPAAAPSFAMNQQTNKKMDFDDEDFFK